MPGLTEPSDMAGSNGDGPVEARLFVSSESDGMVFRVACADVDDVVLDQWSIDDRPYGLSLLGSVHLLVLSREAASVTVLDDDGQPLRRLRLPSSVASPWSAVHVSTSARDSTGDLLVCHGDSTVDTDGRRRRCVSRLDWSTGAVTRRHEWVHQLAAGRHRRSSSMHMVVESDTGGFLLSDQCCDVVQRVDSGLMSRRPLLQTSADADDVDPAVQQPRRLCVDSARQRLVVGLDDGRVKVFANGCVVM